MPLRSSFPFFFSGLEPSIIPWLLLVPTFGSVLTILIATLVFTAFFSYFPARHGGKVPAAVALGTTY